MVLLSALSLTLLASLVASSPTPSSNLKRTVLPVRKSNAGISAKDLVDHGLARIAHYNARTFSKRAGASGVITNEDVSYVADVEICGTTYSLIVDSGSSNTWVRVGSMLVFAGSCVVILISDYKITCRLGQARSLPLAAPRLTPAILFLSLMALDHSLEHSTPIPYVSFVRLS